jgi:membrane-bound lytic murein transglycosylase F
LKDLNFSQRLRRLGLALGLSTFVTGMNGCEGLSWNETKLLAGLKAHGELRVLALEHPLVHDRTQTGGRRGLERDLLLNFAETYGLRLRFIPKKNIEEIYEGLRQGEGDIGAARLWTPAHGSDWLSGPAFEESHLSLFCHRKSRIQHIRDLSNREVLLATKDNIQGLDVRLRQLVPDVQLTLVEQSHALPSLRKVARGKADCVLAENLEGAHFARAWGQIEKISAMTEERSISWILAPEHQDLRTLMNAWFQRASRDDEIMRIQDRYRSALSELDRHDVRRFLSNMRSRLPLYLRSFKSSAREHGLDWRLVASVAYQESQWDSAARSHTGVLGLMQLTAETAAHVGIEDRTDPIQSISGGAFYLRQLINRFPASLDPSERLALALASYNCGWAHIKDIQGLAVRRGLNPYSWRHLKMVLPLLENPEIAAKLTYGGARGRETVQFVERVRAYHGLWRLLE